MVNFYLGISTKNSPHNVDFVRYQSIALQNKHCKTNIAKVHSTINTTTMVRSTDLPDSSDCI